MRPFFRRYFCLGSLQRRTATLKQQTVKIYAGITLGRHQAPGARLSGVDEGRLAGALLVLHQR